MLMAENEYTLKPFTRPCQAQDTVLCFWQENVLIQNKDKSLTLPDFFSLRKCFSSLPTPESLFSISDRFFYGLDLGTASIVPSKNMKKEELRFHPVSIFRTLPVSQDAFALSTAYHLITWKRRHRYCGHCGHPFLPVPKERALHCDCCGQILFPVICPAVSVAITDGDYILLARGLHAPADHFSLVAGYVEVGESLEETVRREVLEEVGLHLGAIHYVGSQAWGFSQSQMIGFHAILKGSRNIVLQQTELAEAKWVHRDALKEQATPLSLSFEMIERFRKRQLPS